MDSIKICVIGAPQSGKSLFIHKFCAFTASPTPPGQEDVWNKKFKIGTKTRMAEFFDSCAPTPARREFLEDMGAEDFVFVVFDGSAKSLAGALDDAEDVMQYSKGPKWLLLSNCEFGKEAGNNEREIGKFQKRIGADYMQIDVMNKVGYQQVQKFIFQ